LTKKCQISIAAILLALWFQTFVVVDLVQLLLLLLLLFFFLNLPFNI